MLDAKPSRLALQGKLFGGAVTELGTARTSISTSTLLRDGAHHR